MPSSSLKSPARSSPSTVQTQNARETRKDSFDIFLALQTLDYCCAGKRGFLNGKPEGDLTGHYGGRRRTGQFIGLRLLPRHKGSHSNA